MTHDYRYYSLIADCKNIESRKNRDAVDEILDRARINANDTVYDESLLLENWDIMFTGTLRSILSEGGHNHHVVAFFTKRNITS